jgi:hypothetical protein
MVMADLRWNSDLDEAAFWPVSDMLDAVELLFPHLDHDLVLKPDDFAAVFQQWIRNCTEPEGSELPAGSIDREEAALLRKMLAPWKAVIDGAEAEIDRRSVSD